MWDSNLHEFCRLTHTLCSGEKTYNKKALCLARQTDYFKCWCRMCVWTDWRSNDLNVPALLLRHPNVIAQT